MDIKFCKECNNILYPKEDVENRTIFLSCRNCDYFQESDNNVLFLYKSQNTARSISISTHSRDLANDKTLARSQNVRCPKCNHNEAVYFQTKDRQEEIVLSIYFVCRGCYWMWTSNKMY